MGSPQEGKTLLKCGIEPRKGHIPSLVFKQEALVQVLVNCLERVMSASLQLAS